MEFIQIRDAKQLLEILLVCQDHFLSTTFWLNLRSRRGCNLCRRISRKILLYAFACLPDFSAPLVSIPIGKFLWTFHTFQTSVLVRSGEISTHSPCFSTWKIHGVNLSHRNHFIFQLVPTNVSSFKPY